MWVFLVFLMYFEDIGTQPEPTSSSNEPTAGSSSNNQTGYELITSQRGGQVLLRAGHKYNKHRKNKDSCVRRCVYRDTCNAKLIINDNHSITRDDRHICEPDFVSNEIQVHFNKCIDEVKTDYTLPVESVFRRTVAGLKDKGVDLITKVPLFKNVKNKFYRHRNKSIGVKKLCFTSIRKVVVPEKFKKILFADYTDSRNRILVFANDNCKKILSTPNLTILCDGTFKFCLKPFKQLYTLHVDLGSSATHNNIIPVMYALLANKARKTYETLFHLIKSQIPTFDPKLIILDFELAAMSAIQLTFPETKISVCFFHFTRSLWRKAEELGITTSPLARKHVKMCTALAHLPHETIDSAWLYIMSQCPNDAKLVKFNDYFVDTWLNESSFFFNKWCCNNMQHRTTNMVESWHATVNRKVNSKPNNIAHFLTILLQEDDYYQTLYLKGSNITRKKKETCDMDFHINTTLTELRDGKISIELCIQQLTV